MTPTIRTIATLAIFAAMLALMMIRPRRWNAAWWTMLAAVAMLFLGLVKPHDAIAAVSAGKNVLLFLLSILALSMLVGKSGFFDWAAIRCARMARGDGHLLYRNVFIAGAIVTAILSLDTTAVILTPILLALVKRLKVPAAPYVLLCAYVANVGSLALPISNLTNLIFADSFRQTFAVFTARMIAPQLAALLTTYAVLRWHYRLRLPRRFDVESLPDPASVTPNTAYFMVCNVVLIVVLIGYFLAPFLGLEPYVIAFAACAVLTLAGTLTGRVHLRNVREIAWDIFPFVVGLFIAVQGMENLGIVGGSSDLLAAMKPGSPGKLFTAAFATAIGSNIANNLPAALIARSVLLRSHAHMETVLAALIGVNVGSMITPFGSLATMLVLAFARRGGEEVRTGDLMLLGLWAVPAILILTVLALALSFALVR